VGPFVGCNTEKVRVVMIVWFNAVLRTFSKSTFVQCHAIYEVSTNHPQAAPSRTG